MIYVGVIHAKVKVCAMLLIKLILNAHVEISLKIQLVYQVSKFFFIKFNFLLKRLLPIQKIISFPLNHH